jgi:hypothetical protein
MALSPKLLQILKDIGAADLQVLVTELVPAIEDEIAVLFPGAAVELGALEVPFNPMIQAALVSLAAKVEF